MKESRSGGQRNLYLLLAGIAVVALVALLVTREGPKQDAFPVDPALAAASVPAEPYRLGSPDAPVQVDQFADFECGACMQFATVTEPDVRQRLIESGQVALNFYFFPLEMHRNAAAAAYAAACAGEQGKFWEMHDALFAGYDDWALGAVRNPKGVFARFAQQIGLDAAKWEACYDSDRMRAHIISHKAEALRRGVNSTPTFFANGLRANGAISYDQFRALADSAARLAPATKPDSSAPPPVAAKS